MSVPNFNRIAFFLQKLLGDPKISKLGHVTLSHAPYNNNNNNTSICKAHSVRAESEAPAVARWRGWLVVVV